MSWTFFGLDISSFFLFEEKSSSFLVFSSGGVRGGFSLEESYISVLKGIIADAGFNEATYELIAGDISNTAVEYVRRRPGAKISLLYLDLDLEKPTYDVLEAFWDIVSVGGLVVFDEYAYHQWSEARGADRFFGPKKIKILNLPYNAPTAYVVKE